MSRGTYTRPELASRRQQILTYVAHRRAQGISDPLYGELERSATLASDMEFAQGLARVEARCGPEIWDLMSRPRPKKSWWSRLFHR